MLCIVDTNNDSFNVFVCFDIQFASTELFTFCLQRLPNLWPEIWIQIIYLSYVRDKYTIIASFVLWKACPGRHKHLMSVDQW